MQVVKFTPLQVTGKCICRNMIIPVFMNKYEQSEDRDYHVLTNLEHCKVIKTIEFCLGQQWGKSMVLMIK